MSNEYDCIDERTGVAKYYREPMTLITYFMNDWKFEEITRCNIWYIFQFKKKRNQGQKQKQNETYINHKTSLSSSIDSIYVQDAILLISLKIYHNRFTCHKNMTLLKETRSEKLQ